MLKEQISFGLARLAALARQDDWRAGELEGLTPTQGDILRLLLQRPDGLRLTALAAQLQISQPTASDAVAALVRKDFAQKHADPDDARALLLRVTRAGRALAKRWPLSFCAVVEAIPATDQAALLGIVMRAIENLQRQGAIAPQRMCHSCRYFVPNAHPGRARAHHCRFINAAIGEADLRVDCAEHEAA